MKKIGLIADSCCDLTSELSEQMSVIRIPLTVRITGGTEYIDDGKVNISTLVADMASSKKGASSACPSVEDYASCMRQFDACFVVTLSDKLSGSYNTACIASDLIREESPDKKIHVFDSKSASAGEANLMMFLQDQIEAGLSFEEIIPLAQKHINSMHTLFILEDLGNLVKNGRLNKVSGLLASVLSLCPIMGDNGDGEIKIVAKVRGIRQSLSRFVETVSDMTAEAAEKSRRLVLAYCNCPERAMQLKEELLRCCTSLRDVVIVPTGALSAMYANNGGVIIAF